MRQSTIGLSLEGLPFIVFCGLATLTVALLGWPLLSLVGLVLTFLVMNFFRDPERVVPQGADVAVSPADGKVVVIDRHRDPLTGVTRQRVCVFMNVFNVHVNRAPVAGTVTAVAYIPGKFFNASLDKASDDNERNVIGLKDDGGHDWTMVQIAGLVARRIVCWTETGDVLARGQRFGLIKFGSRVDLYFPDDYLCTVTIGDNVFAGQTILASRQAAG